VVGTTNDPATPYSWAQALAAQLDSGVLLTRNGEGHTAYQQGSACIDAAIETYLITLQPPAEGTVCQQDDAVAPAPTAPVPVPSPAPAAATIGPPNTGVGPSDSSAPELLLAGMLAIGGAAFAAAGRRLLQRRAGAPSTWRRLR
jgi:hypothetical protein